MDELDARPNAAASMFTHKQAGRHTNKHLLFFLFYFNILQTTVVLLAAPIVIYPSR